MLSRSEALFISRAVMGITQSRVFLIYHLPRRVMVPLLQLSWRREQQPWSTTNLEISLLAAPGTNHPVVLVRKAPVAIITITITGIIMVLVEGLARVMAATVMAQVAMALVVIIPPRKKAWVPLEGCQCHLLHLLPMEREHQMEAVGIDHNLLQISEVEAAVVVVVAVVAEPALILLISILPLPCFLPLPLHPVTTTQAYLLLVR